MKKRVLFLFLSLALVLSACAKPAPSGDGAANTPPSSQTPAIGDEGTLRGEYFDFAEKNRLDYIPFFAEGSAPTDSAEYLFYAFAVNLYNWGEDKGTMTRDYVDKVIHDHFEAGEIVHASMSKAWDYDGQKYTAVPQGINDEPLCVLKSADSAAENGRTVYTVTLDFCTTEEYPLDTEQRRKIRADIIAGDFSALTAVTTEFFRYYTDETSGEPVFLSHILESDGSNKGNTAPPASPDGKVQADTEKDTDAVKYYNYFIDHHTLVDNRVFTVGENTLQDDVIYFAFMNTEPIDGKTGNIRTKKQIDDVLMKYFGIKPKRYSTGISGVTASGDVQLGSVNQDVVQMNRLALKKLTDNGDGSLSAVFKLYQIQAGSAPSDFDSRILKGDPEMEMYHKMDVKTTFTEVPEGESYYLKFSEFTLTPREGPFSPPPQETDYAKKVSRDELKSFHGLSIGMTLDEAKKLLNLPEGAYEYSTDDFADYTLVNIDGWQYTFRTRPKQDSDEKTQYLMAVNIREYPDAIFRGVKLGDAYEDVTKKFPSGKEEGQTPGAPDSYFTRDYKFASTLRSVNIFIGDVHISMVFGRYDTLAWADIYSTDY